MCKISKLEKMHTTDRQIVKATVLTLIYQAPEVFSTRFDSHPHFSILLHALQIFKTPKFIRKNSYFTLNYQISPKIEKLVG